jgi:hypothetical protein
MRNSISKTIVAGLAALTMSAAVISPTSPASAQQWHGGGWHGGGWHGGGWGGGWHGGGWRPGWGGGGWHGAWNGGRSWHPGYWNGGRWYGGWWGPAVVAGLAAGAIATYPYWGGYGYDNGCWAYRPTYDAYGQYLGQQYVNIC